MFQKLSHIIKSDLPEQLCEILFNRKGLKLHPQTRFKKIIALRCVCHNQRRITENSYKSMMLVANFRTSSLQLYAIQFFWKFTFGGASIKISTFIKLERRMTLTRASCDFSILQNHICQCQRCKLSASLLYTIV